MITRALIAAAVSILLAAAAVAGRLAAEVPVDTVMVTSTTPSAVRLAPGSAPVIWTVTEQYVICLAAVDGEPEVYPVPDQPNAHASFSTGEPCPYGRLRS